MVLYVADHANFTGSDASVYDACASLSNHLPGGNLDNMAGLVGSFKGEFTTAKSTRARLKAADQLYLVSMAGELIASRHPQPRPLLFRL